MPLPRLVARTFSLPVDCRCTFVLPVGAGYDFYPLLHGYTILRIVTFVAFCSYALIALLHLVGLPALRLRYAFTVWLFDLQDLLR